MTGVIAGCITGLGISVLVAGTIAGLVIADAPAAVFLAIGLGLPGLPVAGLVLREYLRFRGQFRPRRWFRARPLAGWRLTAFALASAALATGSAVAGFKGSATGSAVLGVAAGSLAMRCAVAGWMERSGRACPHGDPHAGGWTEQDEAILSGDLRLAAWRQAGQAAGEGERL